MKTVEEFVLHSFDRLIEQTDTLIVENSVERAAQAIDLIRARVDRLR